MSDLPTVVHVNDGYDIYIGRAVPRRRIAASKWANPFSTRAFSREEAIRRYEVYLRGRPDLLAALPELRGKRLGCWCKPQHDCHGDVLVRLVEEAGDA